MKMILIIMLKHINNNYNSNKIKLIKLGDLNMKKIYMIKL